jgi:multiple sugar transport system permease protein
MRNSFTKIVKSTFFYIGVIVLTTVIIFPFLWMVFSSFKNNVTLLRLPPDWFGPLTLANYMKVFQEGNFLLYLKNSITVSGSAVVLGLVFGLPCAYSIARFNLRKLSLLIMVSRMIPGISLLVPWFIIFRKLGMINTFGAITISHIVITLPLIIWIMISFFEDISISLEEAAMIDGCSRIGIFLRIILPLSRVGILTAAILGFIFSWNHFLFTLILSGSETSTLPMLVFQFMNFDDINYGGIYAASTSITLPILLAVFFVRKQFISGLTMGSVKE